MTFVSGSWLDNPHTQKVCATLTDAGYQALFVGGCVRNSLLGVEVNDVDVSTDALPETVMNLARSAGLKAIPTGIEHGTITVLSGGIPHEITTFRKDIETDGRRAVVAFSTNVEDDAHRRDFTMNALYADPAGRVFDPLGGLIDLRAGKVRFIDDAEQRIQEDYLRILRYFRFHAFYGRESEGLDPDALGAIAANSAGIESLSKERVGVEFLKLLSAPDPAPSVAGMRSSGALNMVLSGADDRALAPLVHLEKALQVDPEPIRRLVSLGGQDVAEALRLSRNQSKQHEQLGAEAVSTKPPHRLAFEYGRSFAVSAILLRSALLEQPLPTDVSEDIALGEGAAFPVKAIDLQPAFQGKALGAELKRLEAKWIESRFTLSKSALLGLE